MGLADLASLIPLVGTFIGFNDSKIAIWTSSWIGFLRFSRLLNINNLIRIHSLHAGIIPTDLTYALNSSKVFYQSSKLAVNIIVFLFISTGIVFSVITTDSDSFQISSNENELTWFDCFYLVIVSVTTVGYGDIIAVSIVAKLVILAIITTGFGLIPIQVAELGESKNTLPIYMAIIYDLTHLHIT